MSDKSLFICMSDEAFVKRLLKSALNLWESVADADPVLLDEHVSQCALDFEAVLSEGAEEVERVGNLEEEV